MVGGNTIRDIYKRLGIETNLKEERGKVNRRLKIIFTYIEDNLLPRPYPVRYMLQMVQGDPNIYHLVKSLADTTEEDTLEYNLSVAANLITILKELGEEKACTFLQSQLTGAINLSPIDLGITFENDMFIKSGAKELDKAAMLEPLQWLNSYPTTKKLFESALRYYFTKNYPDAITNVYSALESLVRTVLTSDRTLDNLISALLSLLSLPPPWSAILKNYCDFAHEFSTRHGKQEGETRVDVPPKDVEAYIYFTGLMIRLIIRTVGRSE